MKQYSADKIRNVVIAGHGGRGKTTLAEAMLYTAGVTTRFGKVADGNTVLDFDPEEKRRHNSVASAVCPVEWNNAKVNIIDTPGLFDFETGLAEGIRAAETALVVLAAGSGVDVGAEKAIKAATARGMAKFVIVTRCDAENADFYKTLEALKEAYGSAVCPVVVPYMEGDKVKSYVNFLQAKSFTYANGKASEGPVPEDARVNSLHDEFTEAVAGTDEELMMKFFDGEELTHDEIVNALSAGVASGEIFPVYACAAYNLDAVDLVLNGITKLAPAPSTRKETAKNAAGEAVELACDENGPLAAICFKTVSSATGNLSFVKVVSGKITPDTPCYCANNESSQRMGKLSYPKGGAVEEAPALVAGDIGVIGKLDNVKTGDTICSEKAPLILAGPVFPAACLERAITPKNRGEEEKVAREVRKLCTEDPAIRFFSNDETKEQIIAGLGEQHLDLLVSRLKSRANVEVELAVPRVAYRETIKKKVEIHGRHKKQSGGHGQFGDVWIRFEPTDSDELVFAEEVFGGSVPKNFFPAVEKGLRDCVTRGMVAGYPVVGLKATLYDGSYHPVDSSEMAFKTAASLAFKQLKDVASPAILEPIGTLKAYMPDENIGEIMSDVSSKRRGRVLGMGPANEPKMQELIAEVPMAEMGDFSTTLRSVTAGRGNFTLEFTRYEEAPGNVAQKVIEEAHMTDDDED